MNTINNRMSNMELSKPIYPKTARPEHSSAADAQGNNLRNNFTKKIEILSEEMKKSLKETQKKQRIGRSQ